MLSGEDSHACDAPKLIHVHEKWDWLRAWDVILGLVLSCLSTCPWCAPLHKEMGRRKEDLVTQNRDNDTCIHLFGVYIAWSWWKCMWSKAEKEFWPWSHVGSKIIVRIKVAKPALVQRKKYSFTSASPLLSSQFHQPVSVAVQNYCCGNRFWGGWEFSSGYCSP